MGVADVYDDLFSPATTAPKLVTIVETPDGQLNINESYNQTYGIQRKAVEQPPLETEPFNLDEMYNRYLSKQG